MEKLDKVAVAWSGLLPSIVGVLKNWQPPTLKSELAYRNDLLAYLRGVLPDDARLEKEYRHNGTTADIWVRWSGFLLSDELSLELKVNLKKKTEFDRLIGQIESLNPRKHKVLVVLIGATSPELLGRLRSHYAREISGELSDASRLGIVCV